MMMMIKFVSGNISINTLIKEMMMMLMMIISLS